MVKLHVASGLFALASLAVHVTVVVPIGNNEPLTSKHVTVGLPQLSVAVGAAYVAAVGLPLGEDTIV
jgi:hypothetical protein